MVLIAAGVLIAFLVTFSLLPFVIKIAKVNKIYDLPDERKTHNHLISSLGGVGIFSGIVISLLLVADFTTNGKEFQDYIAVFFIIFILGIIDDIFVLGAWKKVAGQFLVAAVLTAKAHLLIGNLAGLAGLYQLNPVADYCVSFFVILLVINAFNLIDGVDGLAASLGLISCVAFGLFFLINRNFTYAMLGFSMSGALLAFLIFNFPPARIFMGDSGSMVVGLVNAILFIKFIQTAPAVQFFPIKSAPAVGFAVLLIPLMDVLRVFILRIAKRTSPFKPDRNHIHHLLLNKGFSHTQVTITLMLSNIIIAFAAIVSKKIDINLLFIFLTLLFFAEIIAFKFFIPSIRSHMRVVSESLTLTDTSRNVKVLSIYGTNDSSAVINEE